MKKSIRKIYSEISEGARERRKFNGWVALVILLILVLVMIMIRETFQKTDIDIAWNSLSKGNGTWEARMPKDIISLYNELQAKVEGSFS